MKRENFFILLELPFSPPTTDTAQIKAAIHAKQQEWTRLQVSPAYQSTALSYIELIPEIEEVMLNPAKRSVEAEAAQKIHNEMISSFEAELRVLEGKGYLHPREISDLQKKYRPYGFDLNSIHRAAKASITDTAPKETSQVAHVNALDRQKAKSIEANLKIAGKKDFYDFLGLPSYSSPKDLVSSARSIHHRAFHAVEKSGETTATLHLADLSMEIFDNDDAKASYDLYRKVELYPDLNDLIDDEFRRSGFITPEILMRLVNFGVTKYQGSVLSLEESIREYCAAYDIEVNIVSPQIACPNCHEHSPRGTVFCPTCAAPLEGNCPVCNTFFTDGATVCTSCSFPLGHMGKALPHIDEAKSAFIENKWSAALNSIGHIEQYWPNHPQLLSLREKASNIEESYSHTIKEIETAMTGNRYYAAKQLADKALMQKRAVPDHLIQTIDSTLRGFEAQLDILKQRDTAEFDKLSLLSSHVADSLELSRMLSQYPPEPPGRFTVRPAGENAQLAWDVSPSTGIIEYIIVRKEGSVPLTAFDGAVLYEGEQNTFLDENVPPLTNFFYSVFSKRGNSYSEIGTVSTKPICVIPNVKNLRIVPANGAAQITWDPPSKLESVKIWRKLGGEKPSASGDGLALETPRLDGFTDTKLKNDIIYWYYVVATYRTSTGSLMESKGVVDSVIPHTLISPIDQYTVISSNDDNYYLVNWDSAPQDEVIFFSSRTKPIYPLGQMLPVSTLLDSYTRLPLDNQRSNSLRFHLKLSGGIYIFPVTVTGKFGAMGHPYYLTNVDNVDNITYDIVDPDLYINFKWPTTQMHSAVAVWRKDGYPKSIDQKGTNSIECTREQYDYDAGLRIPDISSGSYYIKVFAVFESPEGKKIYSTGESIYVDNTPAKEFFYTARYSAGFFASSAKVSLTIQSEEAFHLPKGLLVGKVGSVPLSITDGMPLFEVDRERDVAGSITYDYKSEKLPKDLYVRFFFFDDAAYKVLRPIPGKTLQIT